MKILVLLKAVPSLSETGGELDRQHTELIPNPADLTALEEALTLRDHIGASVTVLTMGIARSIGILRDAVARGADAAILLSDQKFAGSDTCATSRILEAAVRFLGGFDLIFCGRKSTDGETGQVGPELAARLAITCASSCTALSVLNTEACCTVLTNIGSSILALPLPALITFQNGINSPRLPSLQGLRKAKGEEIVLLDAQTLSLSAELCGQAGSPTQVLRSKNCPFEKRQAKRLDGSQIEIAIKIIRAVYCKENVHD